jgi:hypothetical protein
MPRPSKGKKLLILASPRPKSLNCVAKSAFTFSGSTVWKLVEPYTDENTKSVCASHTIRTNTPTSTLWIHVVTTLPSLAQ